MEELLSQFNECFNGIANAKISGNNLEIAIGSKTLIISLPEVIGAQAKDSSQSS